MDFIIHQSEKKTQSFLARPTQNGLDLLGMVSAVFEDIKKEGDKAILNYIEKFDSITFDNSSDLKVTEAEFSEAEAKVSDELKNAIQIAKRNIDTFHKAQIKEDLELEVMPGVICKRKSQAIEKVGLYIPGGTAPLFSTVLMLACPAKIANCKEIVLCTPCNSEKKINPAILYTAKLCGVKNIYKIGGSQAIAAMAMGTETIPEVYKIFGPGNSYVTAAKQYASLLGKAIDMPAGPSEVMVVADAGAKPKHVAADLLSQAEHGADSQAVLLSWSKELIDKTISEIKMLVEDLSRKELIKKSLQNSKIVLVKDEKEALAICNEYAPEHLILQVKETNFLEANVRNCGSVFVGYNTPESAGDYASGTNHTLPTNGYAKQYSGVSLDSFLRHTTYQSITKEALQELGSKSIIPMAKAEGLDAHALAVELRINKDN